MNNQEIAGNRSDSIFRSQGGIMVQPFKLLPALFLIQLPANIPGKVFESATTVEAQMEFQARHFRRVQLQISEE